MTDRPRPLRSRRRPPEPSTGRFTNGMEYAAWGDGPKDLLWMPGGPGGGLPSGAMSRMLVNRFRPLTDDGYRIWHVLRRRPMPDGHTMADMADDYAAVVRDEFGGRVDIAAGVSYGAMVGQYLAARHPETFGTLALVAGAWRASEWAVHLDQRMAEAIVSRDVEDLGEVIGTYLLPNERLAAPRRLLAPVMSRLMAPEMLGSGGSPESALVEARAEAEADARSVLPEITVPVLLIAGDHDYCFPRELVVETAALIPHCTLVWYRGLGHMRTATDPRVALDILQFARANEHALAA
ncbi:MAG: alpha/beta hydrolase [Actinotalea sp.]|nr:alpha/beta hydrolase [Actinotalea sp.]